MHTQLNGKQLAKAKRGVWRLHKRRENEVSSLFLLKYHEMNSKRLTFPSGSFLIYKTNIHESTLSSKLQTWFSLKNYGSTFICPFLRLKCFCLLASAFLFQIYSYPTTIYKCPKQHNVCTNPIFVLIFIFLKALLRWLSQSFFHFFVWAWVSSFPSRPMPSRILQAGSPPFLYLNQISSCRSLMISLQANGTVSAMANTDCGCSPQTSLTQQVAIRSHARRSGFE